MNKLIVLDRDGVINFDSPEFIKSENEWHPIPGSLEAIALLTQHHFTVVVATNQSGIARGYYNQETLNKIHQKMKSAVEALGGKIDAIYVCPHGPDEHCLCRKPRPGLYQQISKDYTIDIHTQKIPAIGDSLRDLEAAELAGFEAILVLTGNGRKTMEKLPHLTSLKAPESIPIYSDLYQVVIALVEQSPSS